MTLPAPAAGNLHGRTDTDSVASCRVSGYASGTGMIDPAGKGGDRYAGNCGGAIRRQMA